MKMSPLDKVGMLLLMIGGLNWGLVGFFDYNLVGSIFGDDSMIARVVYGLVGLAAVWSLVKMFAMMGGEKKSTPSMPTQPGM